MCVLIIIKNSTGLLIILHWLTNLQLNNYRRLKSANLKNLKDLNVIIGPNNCGKTTLLQAINILSRTTQKEGSIDFACNTCKAFANSNPSINAISCSIEDSEKYLRRNKVSISFEYSEDEIIAVLPDFLEQKKNFLKNVNTPASMSPSGAKLHLEQEFNKKMLCLKEIKTNLLMAEHLCSLITGEIKTEFCDQILYCPDSRLQDYKGNSFQKFIEKKDFSTKDNTRLIEFIREIVDPEISDIKQSLNLLKQIDNKNFTTSIDEQGSGVKSLLCLVADILSNNKTKILLIDEPELGLNPSAKHAFLNFLVERSKHMQVFLSTHDPTFVNPILWNCENVSVYLFSEEKKGFVKLCLNENKEDPNTFAGYLPHTTSLKDVHIYVEGSLDVYIFQEFLNKYCEKYYPDNLHETINKIGIHHLGGDFWIHLLSTIPKRPYTSIIVLDGDKRDLVPQALKKVNDKRFIIATTLGDREFEEKISITYGGYLGKTIPAFCPIFILEKDVIEDYLDPRPPTKPEGPLIARKMKCVPKEIENIFNATFKFIDRWKNYPEKTHV